MPDTMNRRIAELRGWIARMFNGEMCWVDKEDRCQVPVENYAPSSDISAAMELWDEIEDNGYEVGLYSVLEDGGKRYFCCLDSVNEAIRIVPSYSGKGDTKELAICRAYEAWRGQDG